MNNEQTASYVLGGIVLALFGLGAFISGIKGIVKGAIQPYRCWNDPRFMYRKERPVLFTIFVVSYLLFGILLIANAILLISGWYKPF